MDFRPRGKETMKNRIARLSTIFLTVVVLLAGVGLLGAQQPAKKAAPAKAAEAASVEKELVVYASRFLPFDPESKVTVEKSSEILPGFTAYKVHRKAHYEKLNADKVVYVSNDGKWFFAG